MSNGLTAFLAGMGGGYLNQKERKRRNDQDDEDRAQRRQLIGMQMDEKQATLDSQQAVRDAGADRVVQDGNAGPMPEGQLVRMGGNGYASKEEAGAAAAPMNTPEAKADRQMSTLMQMDPVKGVALKGAMTQAKEQERQIKMSTQLQEVGGLLARGGWGAVPEIYGRYNDGLSARVEEDGKGGATVITLGKDGKELKRKPYANEMDLFGDVMGGFDPTRWMERKDKKDETARVQGNVDRQFNAGQTQQDIENGLRREELNIRRSTAAKAGAAAGSGGAAIWDDKADDFLKLRYSVKGEDGATTVDGQGLQFAKAVALAQATRNGGDTTSALGYAFQADEAIKQRMKGDPSAVNQERARLLAAIRSGKPAGPTASPGQQPTATTPTARPAAAPTPAPSPSAARPALQGMKPAQTPQEAPSAFSRVVAHMGALGEDFETDAGKARLAQRVKEAATGGKALTKVEKLRAQQQRLISE